MRFNVPIPEKQKSRLYPVVLDLLSQNDFYQVNIRAISKESGVSIGTIYKYFHSKEDLVFSILEEHLLEIKRLQKFHIQGIKSFKEKYRKMLWVVLDYYDRLPGLAVTAFITVPTKTWMNEDDYRLDSELFSTMAKDGLREGEIDSRMNKRRLQDIYYMICYRLIHSWYYFGMKWKLIEAMERDYEIFWKMLAPEVSEP